MVRRGAPDSQAGDFKGVRRQAAGNTLLADYFTELPGAAGNRAEDPIVSLRSFVTTAFEASHGYVHGLSPTSMRCFIAPSRRACGSESAATRANAEEGVSARSYVVRRTASTTSSTTRASGAEHARRRLRRWHHQGRSSTPSKRTGASISSWLIEEEGVDSAITVGAYEGDVDALLAQIRQNPKVEVAEPLMRFEKSFVPDDPQYAKQWNLKMINMPKAWEDSKGKGVIVAVLDTGIAYEDHDDFRQVPDFEGACVSSRATTS